MLDVNVVSHGCTTCIQLGVQPDISQGNECSSSSESGTEESVAEENVINLFQPLHSDERDDELNIFLITRKE